MSGDRLVESPLLKQDQLERDSQYRIQLGFEYFHGWRLHNLSGQPVPVINHPPSREVFYCIEMEGPVLQFLPIVCHCAAGRRLWLPLLHSLPSGSDTH